jgi:hypothetical protein
VGYFGWFLASILRLQFQKIMDQNKGIAFVLHAASHVVDARQMSGVKNRKTKTLILTPST